MTLEDSTSVSVLLYLIKQNPKKQRSKFITHLFRILRGFQKSKKCFTVIFLGYTFWVIFVTSNSATC